MTNLLSYGGAVWMVTVTAPGKDVLPEDPEATYWNAKQRKWSPKVVPHAAHEWNASAQERWSELHRWAYQATCREFGVGVKSLARVWQMQGRGVLHNHLCLGVGSPREHAIARYYVAKLRERTAEFGFGYIDARDRGPKSTVMARERAAGYLSSYTAYSSQLVEAVAVKDRPRRLVWVSPDLTADTFCTMRRLRRVRYLHVIRSGNRLFANAGRLPHWFRDQVELPKVQALYTPPASLGLT
jgi:hypothetical protein